MELLRFCTILAIFIKADNYSLLTDSEDRNSTTIEYSRREIKDMDVLRQIINQETIIRLALTKNVHALLNDFQSMKRTMMSNEALVSSLQQTISTLTIRMDTLQQENQNLKNNSKKCHDMVEKFEHQLKIVDQNLKDNNVKCHLKIEELEKQFTTVDQNITTITENQIAIVRNNDEKRENIANKTNKVVGDIKTEMRNLSVTLLDLKEKIEKENRINDEKSNEIEGRWNTSFDHLKVDHLETRRIFSNLSALIRNLGNSQSEMNRSLMAKPAMLTEFFNNALSVHGIQVHNVSNQAWCPFPVSDTTCNCSHEPSDQIGRHLGRDEAKRSVSNGLNVAFTAGIKSSHSSWSGNILVFPHVIYNEGGGYDANTGVFTALSAGTYVFYFSIQSASQKYIYLDIVLNGSAKARALAWYNSGSAIDIHQTGTDLVVLPLNKADRVWVKRGGGTGYYSDGAHITTFSGFRLF